MNHILWGCIKADRAYKWVIWFLAERISQEWPGIVSLCKIICLPAKLFCGDQLECGIRIIWSSLYCTILPSAAPSANSYCHHSVCLCVRLPLCLSSLLFWSSLSSPPPLPPPSSSPPQQNGHHFADDIFKCIFINAKFEGLNWQYFRVVWGNGLGGKGDKPLLEWRLTYFVYTYMQHMGAMR